jgi:hypothetical protein
LKAQEPSRAESNLRKRQSLGVSLTICHQYRGPVGGERILGQL